MKISLLMNFYFFFSSNFFVFFNILNNLKVYCFLENKHQTQLFEKQNLKQREIAKLINSWQSNVSRTIQSKHLLTIEQFHILNKRIKEDNQFNKIKSIRIGSLTHLENNKENRNFISYIYNLKATNSLDSLVSEANISQQHNSNPIQPKLVAQL